MRSLFLVLTAAALCVGPLAAGTVCPSVTGNPISAASGCDVVITFNSNGTVTVTTDSTAPYEGIEDQLVGVINNTTGAISSFVVNGPTGLFGFDGDGICSGGFISSSLCTTGDSTGYGPNGVTFTGINGSQSSGTVHFSPGITSGGGTGFFSLELAPTAGGSGITVGTVPEPGTIGLLGAGLLGLVAFARKRSRA